MTGSAPSSRTRSALLSERVMPATSWPAWRSRGTSCTPITPLAPARKMRIEGIIPPGCEAAIGRLTVLRPCLRRHQIDRDQDENRTGRGHQPNLVSELQVFRTPCDGVAIGRLHVAL